jgi:hypothetical protein
VAEIGDFNRAASLPFQLVLGDGWSRTTALVARSAISIEEQPFD